MHFWLAYPRNVFQSFLILSDFCQVSILCQEALIKCMKGLPTLLATLLLLPWLSILFASPLATGIRFPMAVVKQYPLCSLIDTYRLWFSTSNTRPNWGWSNLLSLRSITISPGTTLSKLLFFDNFSLPCFHHSTSMQISSFICLLRFTIWVTRTFLSSR